ncbi:MAG: hypothetical protein NPIRA02_19860 [Nitrospirales bacterium]|nr:MAG: hypothetical protein NPIRA02_19860 [Nitrospirales bacterium]
MRIVLHIALITLAYSLLSACASSNNLPEPNSPTMIEQMLMAQAVDFSLEPNDPPITIPVPPGSSLCVRATGLRDNQQFMIGIISGWLGKQGFTALQDCEPATYRVQIIIHTLGVEQSESLFGMPEVNGGLLPFALPELAIYKATRQTGYTRFSFEFFETATKKFLRTTPWYRAKTYFNQYTILFFIEHQTTNLIESSIDIEPFQHKDSREAMQEVEPVPRPKPREERQEETILY